MAHWLKGLFVLTMLCPGVVQSGEIVTNGSMEGPFHQGIAQGWVNNCWGRNTVAFSSGPPHTGKFSQQVTCTSFDSGAVQFYYPLTVRKNKSYKIALWARAEGAVGSVSLGLRQSPEPYKMHLSTSFEPGPDWEQFSLEGTCLDSDRQAGLFVWFAPDGRGTLWVDDVSVVEEEPKTVDLPLPSGNVVPNASFEVDWERDWRSRQVRPSYDAENPFHGQRSLRRDLDGRAEHLVSRLMEFGAGGSFTLGLAARTEGKADVTAELWPGIVHEGQGPLLRLHCQPGSAWKTYHTTSRLAPSSNGTYYLAIHIRPEGRAAVWLDAVRLEPGEAAETFSPRREVEASLSSSALAHIYRAGQPVELTVRAFNCSKQAAPCQWFCRVTDYWRREVAQVPLRLEFPASGTVETLVQIPLKKTGVFLADLWDGKETLSSLSFSVLPPLSTIPAQKSVAGGHFQLDAFHLQVARATGIRWTRIHDCEEITHWRTAEPEKGRFVWFDDKVRLARQHGVEILGEFLRVPPWASSAKGKATGEEVCLYPPRDLEEFAAYVRAVVGHYRNDIHHWEIWTDPYGAGFWRGTPEEYARLAKVAAQETRKADPKAVIVAPSAYPNSEQWIERALAAGATSGVDRFSYHGYGLLVPKGYRRVTEWAAFGGRSQPLAIWNTETGVTSGTFYRHLPDKFVDPYTLWIAPIPYDQATEQCAKLFVLALAGGAERYFHYWDVYEETLLPRLSAMSIFEYDTGLRPMGVAYAVAISFLDGTRGKGWLELPNQILASLLADDQRMIAVLWRTAGRRAKRIAIPLEPSLVDARDLMGNRVALPMRDGGFELSVGGEPLYLEVAAEHLERFQESLRNAKAAP